MELITKNSVCQQYTKNRNDLNEIIYILKILTLYVG